MSSHVLLPEYWWPASICGLDRSLVIRVKGAHAFQPHPEDFLTRRLNIIRTPPNMDLLIPVFLFGLVFVKTGQITIPRSRKSSCLIMDATNAPCPAFDQGQFSRGVSPF